MKRRKDRREREGAGIRGIKAHSERRRLGSAATCWTADPPDEVGADVGTGRPVAQEPASPQWSVCESDPHTGKGPSAVTLTDLNVTDGRAGEGG